MTMFGLSVELKAQRKLDKERSLVLETSVEEKRKRKEYQKLRSGRHRKENPNLTKQRLLDSKALRKYINSTLLPIDLMYVIDYAQEDIDLYEDVMSNPIDDVELIESMIKDVFKPKRCNRYKNVV